MVKNTYVEKKKRTVEMTVAKTVVLSSTAERTAVAVGPAAVAAPASAVAVAAVVVASSSALVGFAQTCSCAVCAPNGSS